MESQRSQLHALHVTTNLHLRQKIFEKYKKNADPNQKSLRLKKRSPQIEKALMQICFSFKWREIKLTPHVTFTFGDYDHFKGVKTRCKHFKLLSHIMQIT